MQKEDTETEISDLASAHFYAVWPEQMVSVLALATHWHSMGQPGANSAVK